MEVTHSTKTHLTYHLVKDLVLLHKRTCQGCLAVSSTSSPPMMCLAGAEPKTNGNTNSANSMILDLIDQS